MKNIKKILALLLALASLIACAASFASCSYVVEVKCVEHQWGEWGIIRSEDCENDGYRARVCQICKETEGEKIPAAHRFVDGKCRRCDACEQHVFGEWAVEIEAGCVSNGSKRRICSVCGESEKETISALGHDFVNSRCTREGCNAIECNEHIWSEWTVTATVTCSQNGRQERTCGSCGEKEIEIIYTKGHSYDGVKCTVCLKPDPSANGGNKELDPDCTHADSNGDELCDLCEGDIIVVIDIYAINDLHGKLFDTDSQPGVDELTTYLKNAYVTDDNVIVLSSGDMWQGTSESNLTHGNMMTEWMNEIGVVSMTLGNHEFDWNNSYIYENLEIASFPFLAINIYDTATDTRVTFATPSVVVERGGAKIGIIGAIGDCYSSVSQDKVTGIEFKVGSALTTLVKAESERLRALGCDMIVYSIHDGLDSGEGYGSVSNSTFSRYYDTMLSSGYVDVVFEAHSHQRYVCTDSYGVYHLQGGGENSGISHVELTLNVITDKVSVGTAENVSSYVYDNYTPDDIIDELYDKYKDEVAKGEELLGYADSYVDGNVLRQVCADQYLKYGLELWGDEYDIVLGGGYIGIRSPYDLYAGEVYYKDIYSLFPFDNALCLCTVKGYKLKSQFINSSNSNYFIATSDYGKNLTINNNDTYYIVIDTYSAFYSYNGCTIVEMLDEEFYARDMIAEYIKDGGLGKKPDISEIEIKTVEEIKDIINDQEVNEESAKEYYILVTITDTPNSTYGNCNVMDETGTLFVYGLKDETGYIRYDGLSVKPVKGDTVLLCGKILLYYNPSTGEIKYEMKNARLIELNTNKADGYHVDNVVDGVCDICGLPYSAGAKGYAKTMECYENSIPTKIITLEETRCDGSFILASETMLVIGEYEGVDAVIECTDREVLSNNVYSPIQNIQSSREYLEGKGVRSNGGVWVEEESFAPKSIAIDITLDNIYDATYNNNVFSFTVKREDAAEVFGNMIDTLNIDSNVNVTIINNGTVVTGISLSYSAKAHDNLPESSIVISVSYNYDPQIINIKQ